LLEQPGLVDALASLADEGPAGAYTGTIGHALLRLSDERSGLLTRDDLAAYSATWAEPVEVTRLGVRYLTRGGLSGVPPAVATLPDRSRLSPTERVFTLVALLADAEDTFGDTTNLVTVDADGSACVLTSSLGLGSGDW